MEETGWRRWIGFGVFGVAILGATLLAAGSLAMAFVIKSCGC